MIVKASFFSLNSLIRRYFGYAACTYAVWICGFVAEYSHVAAVMVCVFTFFPFLCQYNFVHFPFIYFQSISDCICLLT